MPAEIQIDDMITELCGLHLTKLDNNVGRVECIMEPALRLLETSTHEQVDVLIDLNLRFPTQLIRKLWPTLSRTTRPSLIMDIGSLADRGFPYNSVYSGAKSYMMTSSKSLYAEAKAEGRDIEVLGIQVGKVTDVSHRKVVPF